MLLLKKGAFPPWQILKIPKDYQKQIPISVFKELNAGRTFPAAFSYDMFEKCLFVETTLPVFASLC